MKALAQEDTMLDAKDFTKVASVGFGDPHNSYAWSMEWFQGRLYVGTGRDILWLFARMGNHTYLDPYPVPLLPRAKMDLRGQIWRYTPEAGSWEQVYTSPLMTPSPLRVIATIPVRLHLRARRTLSRRARRRSPTGLMEWLICGCSE